MTHFETEFVRYMYTYIPRFLLEPKNGPADALELANPHSLGSKGIWEWELNLESNRLEFVGSN